MLQEDINNRLAPSFYMLNGVVAVHGLVVRALRHLFAVVLRWQRDLLAPAGVTAAEWQVVTSGRLTKALSQAVHVAMVNSIMGVTHKWVDRRRLEPIIYPAAIQRFLAHPVVAWRINSEQRLLWGPRWAAAAAGLLHNGVLNGNPALGIRGAREELRHSGAQAWRATWVRSRWSRESERWQYEALGARSVAAADAAGVAAPAAAPAATAAGWVDEGGDEEDEEEEAGASAVVLAGTDEEEQAEGTILGAVQAAAELLATAEARLS